MALYKFAGRNDEAVFLIDPDLPAQRSITNAADEVVLEVAKCWGNRRIIYRDTMGNWDELVHTLGAFKEFRPLSDRDRARWQEWLIPIGEGTGELRDFP